MNAQAVLDFTPPPERVMLIRPTPEQIRKAKKPQTIRVLHMLQAGPCSTHDFFDARIGNHKARVHELRQVGHQIRTTSLSDSKALYVLVGER